jgi:catechol 2,3-dioxygenase
MVISRLAYVALGAGDADRMLDFYGALFGVVEVERRDGVVYLAGGKTGAFDLALGPWPSGMDRFAFAVGGPSDLAEARGRLLHAGVQTTDLPAGSVPGVEDGVRFVLPSGHVMELVVESAPEVFRLTSRIDTRHHAGIGPVPLEHVTMNCGDVQATASFLIDTLDLRLSESVRPAGAPWFNAFLRCRDRHHDIAFFADPDGDVPSLNHFCYAVPSVQDLVRVADVAASLGVALDSSPGRHVNGNNIFIYLKDPDGNRVEVNTDMAEIDPAAPPRITEEMRFDAWRAGIPPDMLTASPCRDGRTAASRGR